MTKDAPEFDTSDAIKYKVYKIGFDKIEKPSSKPDEFSEAQIGEMAMSEIKTPQSPSHIQKQLSHRLRNSIDLPSSNSYILKQEFITYKHPVAVPESHQTSE